MATLQNVIVNTTLTVTGESNITPVGTIVGYVNNTAPSGWLLCDGALYDSSARPELAALKLILRTLYGGTGFEFNVPNLQEKIPLGQTVTGTGSTLGETGGSMSHSHTGPNHAHSLRGHTHSLMSHTHNLGGHTHDATHTHTLQHTHNLNAHKHDLSAHTHTGTTGGIDSTIGLAWALTLNVSLAHTHTFTTGNNSQTETEGSSTSTGPNTVTSNTMTDSTTGASSISSEACNINTADEADVFDPTTISTWGGTGATTTNDIPYLTINYIIKY